jgi:hypothetical protein
MTKLVKIAASHIILQFQSTLHNLCSHEDVVKLTKKKNYTHIHIITPNAILKLVYNGSPYFIFHK